MANNKESENKFTKEKQRYYRDIINPITSDFVQIKDLK